MSDKSKSGTARACVQVSDHPRFAIGSGTRRRIPCRTPVLGAARARPGRVRPRPASTSAALNRHGTGRRRREITWRSWCYRPDLWGRKPNGWATRPQPMTCRGAVCGGKEADEVW